MVRVNSENQLMTRSVVELDAIHYNHKYQDYYIAMSGTVTANSTNEHCLLYISNNDENKKIYVDALVYGWNGGSTSHNRSCRYRVYKNPGIPTLNYTTVVPTNMHFASSNIAIVTCYKWNAGATDGMTMSSLGTLANDNILAQGLTNIRYQGIPILGYTNSTSISLTAEEVGTFSIVMRFFMKNDSEYNQ